MRRPLLSALSESPSTFIRVGSSSRIIAADTRSTAISRVAASIRRYRRGYVVVTRSGRLRPTLGGLRELLGDVVERRRHQIDAEKPLLLGSAKRDLDDGDVCDVRRGEQRAGSAVRADGRRVGVRDRDEGGRLGFGETGGDQELADLKRVERLGEGGDLAVARGDLGVTDLEALGVRQSSAEGPVPRRRRWRAW